MQIRRETLITKNRQPFFERQLEPIPTGDAIPTPVMKVFMGDHTFDALKFCISGCFRISQNKLELKIFRLLFSIAPILK